MSTKHRRFVEVVVTSAAVSGAALVELLGSADTVESLGESGERFGRARTFDESAWVVRSGVRPEEPMDHHLHALWLRTHRPLADLAGQRDFPARCLLRIVQYVGVDADESHGFGLSADWLRLLAAVDGEIDVDQDLD